MALSEFRKSSQFGIQTYTSWMVLKILAGNISEQ